MPMTQAEDRRRRAENIMRILEDYVDTLIAIQIGKHMYSSDDVVASVLAEHRENLTQEIEGLL